jgi:hypothetical protein
MLVAGFTAKEFVAGFDACKLATEEERCVRYRRGPNHHSVTAASVFIRFLQHQGELPLPVAPPSTSDIWPMLGEFRSWMRKHRGLTETTLDVYQGILGSAFRKRSISGSMTCCPMASFRSVVPNSVRAALCPYTPPRRMLLNLTSKSMDRRGCGA